MIGVIDLGLGNIKSVVNALKYISVETKIIDSPENISKCHKIILPGVGAFGKGCEALQEKKFTNRIKSAVLEENIPILGICLGMQLLGCNSEETPGAQGLGLIEGNSRLIKPQNNKLKVPHVGWNDVIFKTPSAIFNGIDNPVFYFLHSYHVELSDSDQITAISNYDSEITVAFSYKNIHGVQFHPEKSQEAGIHVLTNFCK